MLLYADEDFPYPAVVELRRLGHDVLTAQEDGRRAASDVEILARANALGRAVLNHNQRHYQRLHKQGKDHSGIITASRDTDDLALADRINTRLVGKVPGRWCIRVNLQP